MFCWYFFHVMRLIIARYPQRSCHVFHACARSSNPRNLKKSFKIQALGSFLPIEYCVHQVQLPALSGVDDWMLNSFNSLKENPMAKKKAAKKKTAKKTTKKKASK